MNPPTQLLLYCLVIAWIFLLFSTATLAADKSSIDARAAKAKSPKSSTKSTSSSGSCSNVLFPTIPTSSSCTAWTSKASFWNSGATKNGLGLFNSDVTLSNGNILTLYRTGSYATAISGRPMGGFNWYTPIGGSYSAATLSFNIYFGNPDTKDVFQPTPYLQGSYMGGKLPGFYGGTTGTCNAEYWNLGGSSQPCFASRLMWRSIKDVSDKVAIEGLVNIPVSSSPPPLTFSSNSHPTDIQRETFWAKVNYDEQYNGDFGVQGSSSFGDWSIGTGFATVSFNTWYTVKEYIQVNTFSGSTANADGKLEITITPTSGGQASSLVIDQLVWTQNPALKIDTLFMSSFFGGGRAIFASPKDNYIAFSKFEVVQGGGSGGSPTTPSSPPAGSSSNSPSSGSSSSSSPPPKSSKTPKTPKSPSSPPTHSKTPPLSPPSSASESSSGSSSSPKSENGSKGVSPLTIILICLGILVLAAIAYCYCQCLAAKKKSVEYRTLDEDEDQREHSLLA